MDDVIDQTWRRIETSLSVQTPTTLAQLAPGAAEQAIKELENIIGATLPQDFRVSYRRHDGGYTVNLVSPMEIMSLPGIADSWRMLEELLHDDQWARQEPYYFTGDSVKSGWQTGPIQPVWWNRRWIPFGSDSTGNLSCLDLDPAAGGTVGQIIDWDHECGPSRVLFPGFRELLEAFADQMESGKD